MKRLWGYCSSKARTLYSLFNCSIVRLLISWPVLFGIAFVLFFVKSYFTLDPDFGWHITLGKYILLHGIPKTDPFSYSMPSFPFIDHEWLTNVVMYVLFNLMGTFGMALLWSFVGLLALGIAVLLLPKNFRHFGKIFFLLATVSLLTFVGIRTQVLSWLFFTSLIFLLSRKTSMLQLIGSGLLFLLWVNVHGSFPVGLILIAFAALFKKQKKLWILFFICCVLSFINPYGGRLWGEVWNQLSDSSLRFSIQEWFPSVIYPLFFSLWIFIGVISVVAFSNWKKVELFFLAVFILFALLGASSIRHMPFVLFIGIPLGGQAVAMLQQRAHTFPFGNTRFLIAYKLFVMSSVAIICIQLLLSNFFGLISSESSYPKQEVAYLQNHLPMGNLFSIYDWGGYLIWKFPEKKVFIDGRMPSWRWQAPMAESSYAFSEMQNVLLRKENLSFFVKKYHISAFLLPKENKKNIQEVAFVQQLIKRGYKVVFTGDDGKVYETE